MDLPARKARLRARMTELRRGVAPHEATRAAEVVARRVGSLPAFRDATDVALYAALADELPSRPLLERVVEEGKRALFPRVEGDGLVFCAVAAWEELVPGRYGVPEPPLRAARVVPAGLVVVPGVAFDREGHRLGRGKGYYDRAFAAAGGRQPVLVGVGYAFQLLDELPHGPDDRRMDAVVTDSTEIGEWD